MSDEFLGRFTNLLADEDEEEVVEGLEDEDEGDDPEDDGDEEISDDLE